MSQDDWNNKIERAALDLIWSHWITLGAHVEGMSCRVSVDPEALILLTAILAPKDLRLIDVMQQWLQHYESIVNVERLKTALKLLPEDNRVTNIWADLSKVLRESIPAKSHKRWSKIISLLEGKSHLDKRIQKVAAPSPSRKKLQPHPWILARNSLLSFRYVVGVSAKADILYFLSVYSVQPKTSGMRPATGAQIAKMLHYDPATTLRALEELKNAELIFCNEANAEYALNLQSPHFSWPPKASRFFLDWFALFPVVLDILSLEEVDSTIHETIVLDRLNKRLEALDIVLKMVPRSHPVSYAKANLVGISQADLRNSYEQAFYEIADAVQSSPRLDWGGDGLTRFLDTAQRNLWASYAHLEEFRRLMRLDRLFEETAPHLGTNDTLLEGIFVTRCHSAYRGAVRVAASGELPEAFALMRSALENALYAFHIHRNPKKGEIWMKRGDDTKSKKDSKKAFEITPILKEYESLDSYNGAPAKNLYDTLIDYGAHPNADSVYTNISLEEDEKGKRVLSLQLNTNELPLKYALVNVARTGGCCLFIFENIYRKRFQSSGLSEKLRGVIEGL
jgi:tetratricopeptide (TPR) repeat protein